jgi:hypothetical protein
MSQRHVFDRCVACGVGDCAREGFVWCREGRRREKGQCVFGLGIMRMEVMIVRFVIVLVWIVMG